MTQILLAVAGLFLVFLTIGWLGARNKERRSASSANRRRSSGLPSRRA